MKNKHNICHYSFYIYHIEYILYLIVRVYFVLQIHKLQYTYVIRDLE